MSAHLLTLLGAHMPEEMMIDLLEEAVNQYKVDGDLAHLASICMLVGAKAAAESTEGGAEQLLKNIDRTEAARQLLDDTNQKS